MSDAAVAPAGAGPAAVAVPAAVPAPAAGDASEPSVSLRSRRRQAHRRGVRGGEAPRLGLGA